MRLEFLLALVFLVPGCIFDDLALDTKRCPCASGFFCDEARGVCVLGPRADAGVDGQVRDTAGVDSSPRPDVTSTDSGSPEVVPLDAPGDRGMDSGAGEDVADDVAVPPDVSAVDVPDVPIPTCDGVPGLLARFAFEETSGLLARDDARGLNATVFGARFEDGTGSPCGRALRFSPGEEWADVESDASIDAAIGSTYTLMVWARAGAAAGQNFPTIVSKENGTPRVGPNLLARSVVAPSTWSINSYVDGRSNTARGTLDLRGGRWVHAVVVRRDGNQSTFENGTFVNAQTTFMGDASNELPLRLGGRATPAGRGPTESTWFEGAIDELRVFDRELTSAEIRDTYLRQLTGDCGC